MKRQVIGRRGVRFTERNRSPKFDSVVVTHETKDRRRPLAATVFCFFQPIELNDLVQAHKPAPTMEKKNESMQESIKEQLGINQKTKAAIEETAAVLKDTRRFLKITTVLAIVLLTLNLGQILDRIFDLF